MANPSVKTGIAQEANLAFALWVSPDIVEGSGAWDAKNTTAYPKFGTLNSVALGSSGKNGLVSTATNCGVAVGGANNHSGTVFDFADVTWTVVALVRPITGTGVPVIFQNRDGWSPNYGLQLGHSGTYTEAVFRGSASTISGNSSSGTVTLNQVMTLSMVCDATTFKTFKNGTQVASVAHTETSVNYASTATRVAGLFNTAQAKGASATPLEIYAVIGWNSALTPAEIQSFGTTEAALLAGDFYTAAFDFSAGSALSATATGSAVASGTASPILDSPSATLNASASGAANAAGSANPAVVSVGTITIPELRAWETGNKLTSESGITVWVNDEETGSLVAKLTGLTSHATTADIVVTHASIVAGTHYSVRTRLASGAQSTWTYIAT